jgi:cytochrome c553
MVFFYRRIGGAALAVAIGLCMVGSRAADNAAPAADTELLTPSWGYPVTPPPEKYDDKIPLEVPESARKFTRAQIEADYNPPDWRPDDHPPMPTVVEFGRRPAVRACMKCHLPNGSGHPESSDLAGLTAKYIEQQMTEFANGNRNGARARSMIPIAKGATAEEVRAAAEYYAGLKPTVDGWQKVVEAATVPKSHLKTGGMRFIVENGGSEPIAGRIIELPQDPLRAERRDDRSGFIAYVPPGSIAKGKTLVTTGGGKTMACTICHGPDLRGNGNRPELKGLGEVPNLAGRSPIYIFRQLNDYKIGTRHGPLTAPMLPVVANLDHADMVAIAAYLTSLGGPKQTSSTASP